MPSTRTGLSVNSLARSSGADHHRSRAVADERAVVNGQRVGDRLSCQRLLQRDHLSHVRVGILRPVGVILHRDRGQVLPLGAVLVHMTVRDHGKQRRKRRARLALGGAIARHGENLGHPGRLLRGHLFNARDQHEVVQPGRDRRKRMEEGRPARRARRFDPGARHTRNPHRSGDIRSKMTLAYKRWAGEIAQIESLHLAGLDSGVRHRLLA